MMNDKEGIAKRIKDLIYKKGITISQFAQGAGIDQSNLSSILNGKRKIGSGVLSKIALAYDINTEWLTTGEGEVYKSLLTVSEKEAEYTLTAEYKEKYIKLLEAEISLLKKTISEQSQIIQGFMDGSIQKIK